MAGTKISGSIKFIADNGEEAQHENTPTRVLNLINFIEKLPAGELRTGKWCLDQIGAGRGGSKELCHPAVKDYRIKCNMDGKAKVWVGCPEDIANIKKEFTKKNVVFTD